MRPDKNLFFSHTYEFLERYLPLQVGRSRATIESYRDALTVFRRYVVKTRNISLSDFTFGQCDRDFLLCFSEHLQKKGYASGTVNQRLSAIRAYLWFASDSDVAIQSVAISASHIPPVKGAKREREKLSENELIAMFSAPDARRRIGLRDRMILILLYDSGIRLSELLGLCAGDVVLDVTDPYIFVRGKGNKERIVALSIRAEAHLKQYITVFHGEQPKPTQPLFFTTIKGVTSHMSPSNVERMVQKHADRARMDCPSIPEKVYPHMLRRSRATDLYQCGVALELVSRILGHSSVTSTKAYAKPSLSMLRKAMELSDNSESDELPLWTDNEDEMARLCGLR